MLKYIPIVMLCSSQMVWASETDMPIIDSTVCQSRGAYLYNCSNSPVNHRTTQTYAYVPLETHVALSVSSTCSVSHINIRVYGDGTLLDSRSIASAPTFSVDQAQYQTMTVSVTPFRGYYSYACDAGALVSSDVVNKPKLTSNLTERKAQAQETLALLIELIESQRLVLNLNAAVKALLAIVELAETEIGDHTALSDELEQACANNLEGEACTWIARMFLITENLPDMPIADKLLLYRLGQHLDQLIQEECTDEDCDLSLIDDETRALIASIQEEVPDDTDIEAKMAENIVKKGDVENQIAEYQSVAAQYGIDWEAL